MESRASRPRLNISSINARVGGNWKGKYSQSRYSKIEMDRGKCSLEGEEMRSVNVLVGLQVDSRWLFKVKCNL